MAGVTRQGATDDPNTDPVLNSITDLAGVLREHFVDPLMGSPDQWAVAQQKAQAGDSSMLQSMLTSPAAGWVSPQPSNEPAPGTPEHQAWWHNQVMDKAMALAGSGVIAGEGAVGAGGVPPAKWYTGADNMRRFEIPDYQSKFDNAGVQQYINERDRIDPGTHIVGEVGEVLDHPPLYNRYPDAAKIPLYIAPTVGEHAMGPLSGGGYIKPTEDLPHGAIMLNPQVPVRDANGTAVTDANGNVQGRPATGDELHSALMHEINHYIQHKEGFSAGTNPSGVLDQLKNAQSQIDARITQLRTTSPGHPDIAKLINESDNIDRLVTYDPHHLYSTEAGEVESFNTEDRMAVGKELLRRGYSPDEINRRLGLPTTTQPVPTSQQLVFPSRNQPAAGQIKLQPVDHTPETAPVVGPGDAAMTRGFHGTGAPDFDQFSNEFIGTGEGHQAYGWGHYIAGNEKVGVGYQEKLAGKEPVPYKDGSPMSGIDALEAYFQPGKIVPSYGGQDKVISFDKGKGQFGGDWSVNVRGVDKDGNPLPGVEGRLRNHATYPRPIDFAAVAKDRGYDMGKPGSLLEVAMKPDEHELLDYDAKVKDMHPEMQAKLKALGFDPSDSVVSNMSGEQIYDLMRHHISTGEMPATPQAASQALHAAGIPGLKFLDQGSRGKGQDIPVTHVAVVPQAGFPKVHGYTEGDSLAKSEMSMDPKLLEAKFGKDIADKLKDNYSNGKYGFGHSVKLNKPTDLATRNYVIFDPSNIKITAKNGKRLIPIDHDPFAPQPKQFNIKESEPRIYPKGDEEEVKAIDTEAHDPESGKKVGNIQRLHWANNDPNQPGIGQIWTDPAFRRQGIATQMIKHLADKFGYKNIHWGIQTEEGKLLKAAMDKLFGEDQPK